MTAGVQSGKPYILLLEDDCVFVEGGLEQLLEKASCIDFDLLYGGYGVFGDSQTHHSPVFQTDGMVVLSHCILMTRQTAEQLIAASQETACWEKLQNSEKHKETDLLASDVLWSDYAIEHHLKRFLCNPKVAHQKGGESDNAGENNQGYPKWHDLWTGEVLTKARIFVAACKAERIEKLPEQLAKLELPYEIERELPRPDEQNTKVYLDNASRRFRQQVTSHVDRPLLWLEDDADFPDDFLSLWTEYERTLPTDWKAAVMGWGAIYCDGEEGRGVIRKVSPGWWHLERLPGGKYSYPVFGGSQAVLLNAGEWRLQLRDKIFRCDVELCKVLAEIGVTEIYHTDRTLIGTNDPYSVHGNPSVMYPKMQEPKYWSWKRMMWREVLESDFVECECQ